MRSHAVLNNIVVLLMLSGVCTPVRPICAERCQPLAETGPASKDQGPLSSFVQNMVQNINACLNQTTTWTVSGCNPVVLIPQSNNSGEGCKKTFTWRQVDIIPPAPGETKTVCRIRCVPRRKTDKTFNNVKNVNQLPEKQRYTYSSANLKSSKHEKEENDRGKPKIQDDTNSKEEERVDKPPQAENITTTEQSEKHVKEENDRGKPKIQDDTNSKEEERGEKPPQAENKTTTEQSEKHVETASDASITPAGNILIYERCKNSPFSIQPKSCKKGINVPDGMKASCNTQIVGGSPSLTALNCLACLQAETEHDGNVHPLKNSKYCESSMKIEVPDLTDDKLQLTEEQIQKLGQLDLTSYDMQSLMRSNSMVVQVEDKSTHQIRKYIIVDEVGDMLIGVPCCDEEESMETTTTTPTTTPAIRIPILERKYNAYDNIWPMNNEKTEWTKPKSTTTSSPTTLKPNRSRNRFIVNINGKRVDPRRNERVEHCIDSQLCLPQEGGARTPFPDYPEPLANILREPLVRNRPQVMSEHPNRCGMTCERYYQTTTLPNKNQDCPYIYKICSTCPQDNRHWHMQDQTHADDCEDNQDCDIYALENAATSAGADTVRKWPHTWNVESAQSTPNAPKSLAQLYKETHNERYTTNREPHKEDKTYQRYQQSEMPTTSFTNQMSQLPRHRLWSSAQQKQERVQPAKMPEYLTTPPQNLATAAYYNNVLNTDFVQTNNFQPSSRMPVYNQPTWRQNYPSLKDRARRVPQHSGGNYRNYNQRIYHRPMEICNPPCTSIQPTIGYTLPPRINVC